MQRYRVFLFFNRVEGANHTQTFAKVFTSHTYKKDGKRPDSGYGFHPTIINKVRSNHLNSLLLAELQAQFLQLELLNLATSRQWEFVNEEHVLGCLVAGYLSLAEVLHVLGFHLHAFLEDNEGTHLFAVFL